MSFAIVHKAIIRIQLERKVVIIIGWSAWSMHLNSLQIMLDSLHELMLGKRQTIGDQTIDMKVKMTMEKRRERIWRILKGIIVCSRRSCRDTRWLERLPFMLCSESISYGKIHYFNEFLTHIIIWFNNTQQLLINA